MQLADAVEQWGIQRRRDLADKDTTTLRLIWRTLRHHEVGELEVTELDDRRSSDIMDLFDRAKRPDVARLLNSVAQWEPARSGESSRTPRVLTGSAAAYVEPQAPPGGRRPIDVLIAVLAVVAAVLAVIVVLYLFVL